LLIRFFVGVISLQSASSFGSEKKRTQARLPLQNMLLDRWPNVRIVHLYSV
jgi:hypothetical protein